MKTRVLGKTGLEVTRLGMGLAAIGEELRMEDELDQVDRVLNSALDGGVNFLDTSACYFDSEEMVGRTISHRRDEYLLATKCGHATGGHTGQPWTAQVMKDSIERSLVRMRTDHLDILQLHSCDVETLEKGEVIEVLLEAKRSGKTRFIGYSGDNEKARWAVASGLFDTLQTSFNLTDQRARTTLFGPAKAQGMGLIVKRPIANGAWGADHSPSRDLRHDRTYANEYFRRAQEMAKQGPIPGIPEDGAFVALGFVFGHPEVDTAIVGTMNAAHMASNIERVERDLPIPTEVVEELQRRFEELGAGWGQRQ